LKRIITYGTFDLLHLGHINLLRRAKELGDELIVGLSTDEFNEQKHKQSYLDYEHRKVILESIRFVDRIIPENSWNQKIPDIKNFEIDTFVMGGDWEGEFELLKDYCEVIYFERTVGISTTYLKSMISGRFQTIT
jgi:glycerol-3-phosphate cytidylyltransferase